MQDCFVILANHQEKDRFDLLNCLSLLEANHPYPGIPLILFHEEPLIPFLPTILKRYPRVRPVKIDFGESPVPKSEWTETAWRLGYRHMCQFFAYDWYFHPALSDFQYVCRLDTDSEICMPCPNLFEKMRKDDGAYGYIATGVDNPSVCEGLWDLARRFESEYGSLVKNPVKNIQKNGYYYTNFELCYTPWFRSDPYKQFVEYVMADGGIYRCRWGDAIIRYLAIQMFMDQKKVWKLNVMYRHQAFTSEIA